MNFNCLYRRLIGIKWTYIYFIELEIVHKDIFELLSMTILKVISVFID